MTYHVRKDLPYQYALADAFTICDNYFCSLMGPTDPNRYHMWTGWVGNDGQGGGPVITNAELGYGWSTYPERLERNGISWKIYQDIGVGLNQAGFWGWTDDPFIGNYGDNSLLYFHRYRNAQPGEPWADKAKTGTEVKALGRDPERLLDVFRDDVANGRLPQVSWLVPPEAYTEHPNWAPDFGAWYVSQVVDILASNPDVWSKMALFITYDEDGGFFDHLVPPTPPRTTADGRSTVSTVNEIYSAGGGHPTGPYGFGVRVPMIVVSPWTRGGWVNSQLFDHTSLIRFLEARFADGVPDLVESNITPWRRAVAGDLTSAFDFETPNSENKPPLPSTADDKPEHLVRVADEEPVPPLVQRVPKQERGVRPARALPYRLHADLVQEHGATTLALRNTGDAAAVFHVRTGGGDPKTYTVEAGKSIEEQWPQGSDFAVHGPNGFFRSFRGNGKLVVASEYDEGRGLLVLTLRNPGSQPLRVNVLDGYTKRTTRQTVAAGRSVRPTFSLRNAGGWYDVRVALEGVAGFEIHYAGHVENGADSISDPLMGSDLA